MDIVINIYLTKRLKKVIKEKNHKNQDSTHLIHPKLINTIVKMLGALDLLKKLINYLKFKVLKNSLKTKTQEQELEEMK